MSIVRILFACATLCAGLSECAEGALIQVNFSAKVTDGSSDVLGLSASVGDLVTGTFLYDTDAVDTELDAAEGRYFSGSSSFLLNGHTVSGSGVSHQHVLDYGFPYDVFAAVHGASVGTGPVLIDGVAKNSGRYHFAFSGSLPSDTVPGLAEFGSLLPLDFKLMDESTGNFIAFHSLVSVTAGSVSAVPEPSTLAMFVIGGIGMTLRAARRRLCAPGGQ